MTENTQHMFLEKVKPIREKPHIPSRVQADTLFTFTKHIEFLLPSIRNKMISPRYCVEDIKYLKISGLKQIAYPMKCFCDINLHRLADHLSWYPNSSSSEQMLLLIIGC